MEAVILQVADIHILVEAMAVFTAIVLLEEAVGHLDEGVRDHLTGDRPEADLEDIVRQDHQDRHVITADIVAVMAEVAV